MTWLPLPSALEEISSRNAAIAASYRDWARRIPPGPVSKLANSMAEQRIDLGKALRELAVDGSLAGTRVEFDSDPASAAGVQPFQGRVIEPKELLQAMAEAEAADHELLAALAGALLPASSDAAERVASEADSARKRSIWAQDHLDLLDMA